MRLKRLLPAILVVPAALQEPPSAARTPTQSAVNVPTVAEWTNEPEGYRGYKFGTRFQEIVQKEGVSVSKPDWYPYVGYTADPTSWQYLPYVDLRTNARVWKCFPESLELKASRLCGRLPLRPEEFDEYKREHLSFDGKNWYGKMADGTRQKVKTVSYNPLPANEGYYFTGDMLDRVAWTYLANHFSKVADVLVARYGPPTGADRENVTNKMGATLENVTYTWLGKRFAVRASRFQSDFDSGVALFTSVDALKELARIEEERKRKAVKVF